MSLSKNAVDSLAWIRANLAEGGGVRVSARQHLAYPEVTGYLIPSLLRRGETELARAFGAWLVRVQGEDGSFRDPEGRASFAFDTGQVIRGLAALLDVAPEFEQPLRRACWWMIAASDAKGRLPVDERLEAWDMGDRGRICEGVHLYALPGMIEAAERLDEPRFRDFALRSRNWYLDHLDLVDFRRRNQLTHLFCYVQEALVDLGAADLAAAGMKDLAGFQKGNGSVPAFSDVGWICTPGQLQAAITWKKLGEDERAERALSFAETLVNPSHGFFGSYGEGAAYFPDDEPSWAVKFHMDAVDLVRPEPARQVPAARPDGARAGKTLDANLDPDDWHDSIVGTLAADDVAARVRAGGVPPWVAPILERTREGQTVLELGSGTGELSAALAGAGRKVTLLDFSARSLEVSKDVLGLLGLEGETVQGDVLKRLPFEDRTFDCVWSSGLLEHFDDDQILHIVAESARVSRGVVIALVPNARSLPYRLGKWNQERSGTWIWGREDPKASLKTEFEAAGLIDVHEWTIAPEHALSFLESEAEGPVARELARFYAALDPAERAALGQGYLLVTLGRRAADRDEVGPRGKAARVAAPRHDGGAPRRLAVVPNDPVQAYVDAGYPDLTRYFNPGGAFDEVYCLAEHEPEARELYGMKIVPTRRDELGARMRELGIDVLRAYDLPSARWADAGRDRAVPFVVSVHDTDARRYADGLPAADLFLAVSGAVERELERHGAGRETIRRLPNRVDLKAFRRRDDAARRAEFERRFPGRRRILHVGRRCEQKNLETVIAAIARLGEDWVGVFVGRGDAAPYRALARELGVDERCHFVDAVPNDELSHWYSYADCLCVPSLWEGFGIVFIEALACSTPVVTSDIAPMNEFVEDGKSGLLARDPRDPDEVAALVRMACESEGVRERLMRNARRAARPFSRRAVDAREKKVYRGLMRRRAARTSAPREPGLEPAAAPAPLVRGDVRVLPLRRASAPAWDAIVAGSPDAWFFHRFAEQALLEEAWPGESLSFLLEIGGRVVGICPLQRWKHDRSVLHSTMMGTGGPAIAGDLAPGDRAHVAGIMHGLLTEIVKQPGVAALHASLPPQSLTARGADGVNPLVAHGWHDTSTLTTVIDLERPVEAIWNGMHGSYRADVEKARSSGMTVEAARPCEEHLADYYALHVETYRRTGVEPHPRAYFESIFRHFVADGTATILFARENGRAIGAANVASFRDASLYWTGAYAARGLELGCAKLLQWEAMVAMRERGVRLHETGEVFPEAAPRSKEAGLTLFKRRFGGEVVPFFKGVLFDAGREARTR